MVHVHHMGVALPMTATYVWCDADPRGAMHGWQLWQLVDTLVTLAVMCWQLACRVVWGYHFINRHSGKMQGLFSS